MPNGCVENVHQNIKLIDNQAIISIPLFEFIDCLALVGNLEL